MPRKAKAVPPSRGREQTRKKRRKREREAKKAKRLAGQRARGGNLEAPRGQFSGAKEAELKVSTRRPLSIGSKNGFTKARTNIPELIALAYLTDAYSGYPHMALS